MESKSCLMLKWFKHCFALLLKGDAMTGWRLLCTYTPACQPRHNIGVNDTPVFLLNEYIVELNPANFNILNQILNWIFLKFLKLNNFLNLISLNWIMFWIEFCAKFSYWIFYWIEFCPKISYWIFYWTESGLKTENQLYFVILYPKIP